MRCFMGLVALTCCALAGGSAEAERRLALSVGIDVYDNLPAHEQLRKAVNDARAVGAALRELGFGTAVEENLPRLAVTRAWQKFHGIGDHNVIQQLALQQAPQTSATLDAQRSAFWSWPDDRPTRSRYWCGP